MTAVRHPPLTFAMNEQTPFQEAISVISIAAILVSVGCFLAAAHHAPVLFEALVWVAIVLYRFYPALGALPMPGAWMLVSAAAVGMLFFLMAIPFAYWLAGLFSRGGIRRIETQTYRLKKQRYRLEQSKRDRDDFLAS